MVENEEEVVRRRFEGMIVSLDVDDNVGEFDSFSELLVLLLVSVSGVGSWSKEDSSESESAVKGVLVGVWGMVGV